MKKRSVSAQISPEFEPLGQGRGGIDHTWSESPFPAYGDNPLDLLWLEWRLIPAWGFCFPFGSFFLNCRNREFLIEYYTLTVPFPVFLGDMSANGGDAVAGPAHRSVFWGGVNEATSSFFLIAKSANGNKNYWDSL